MLHQFGDQTGDNELCVQPVLLQTGRIRQRLNTNPGNIKVFDSWNIWNVHSEKKGDQNYNEIQRNLLLLLYGYIHLFTNMICTCNCDVHHQVLPNLTPLSTELLGCKHSHNHQLRNRFTNNVAFSWLSELILEFKWMNVFFTFFFRSLCSTLPPARFASKPPTGQRNQTVRCCGPVERQRLRLQRAPKTLNRQIQKHTLGGGTAKQRGAVKSWHAG